MARYLDLNTAKGDFYNKDDWIHRRPVEPSNNTLQPNAVCNSSYIDSTEAI
jgi:hypothetical protein